MENRTTRRLATSIEKLSDEVKKSNDKEEIPIKTQKLSAKASIWGVFISTILTIFIFWYSCTTNTKIDGMSDLLLKQDTAIHKQDTSNQKQDSLIGLQISLLFKQDISNQKQEAINGNLTSLLDKQNSQIGLMTQQVLSLKQLVEKNQRLDSLGTEQNKRLENVLKQLRDMLEIQNKNYTAAKRISYDDLYNLVHGMPRYQPLDWPQNMPDESTANRYLWIAKSVKEKLDSGRLNPYLTYDTAAGNNWSNIYRLTTELIRVIETKELKYPIPNFDYPAARRKRMMELFTEFTNAYKKFIESYGVVTTQD
jgi:hypothetical protein